MSELSNGGDHNDAPDADIVPVVDSLQALDTLAVKEALDREFQEKRAVDKRAGIVIAGLPDIEPITVNGQVFRFYGARILPIGMGKPSYVNPHVHQKGQEPYVMLDGLGGEMNTGTIEGERVVWDEPRPVAPGEVIIIEEGQVHSLRNTSDTAFDFAFACPDSHLQDYELETPQGDRVFTSHLNNPVPPHYPPPEG